MALAAGIQSNIDDQNNELTTVNALGMVLAQNPIDMTLYGATQTSLMGFVTKGIVIRENNQKLAPAGNAALDGLAKVANAQMEELSLTMSLAVPASGAVDPVCLLLLFVFVMFCCLGGKIGREDDLYEFIADLSMYRLLLARRLRL